MAKTSKARQTIYYFRNLEVIALEPIVETVRSPQQ